MRKRLVLGFVVSVLLGAPFVVGSAAMAAPGEWRAADQGEWKLVWSLSEAVGLRNDYPDLGLEVDFPVRWRHVVDSRGSRLYLFDEIGRTDQEIVLADEEHALASRDGSVHLRWTEDPDEWGLRHVSYWRAGAEEPDWEASAAAAPCLLADDGGVLTLRAGSASAMEEGGRLQIVGAAGEIREELSFAPLRMLMTADGRRLILLRPGELIALDRDGTLAWSVRLPIDDAPAREGARPIACGENRIAVCGSGVGIVGFRGGLHLERLGALQVFDGRGRLKWERRQESGADAWFGASVALAVDGQALVFVRSGARGTVITLHDGGDGAVRWETRIDRRVGFRHMSLTPNGDFLALAHGGTRTYVVVWNAAGDIVFEGGLPLEAQTVSIAEGGLLVADQWVVQIRYPGSD